MRLFAAGMREEPRPEQSRAFMEMTREIEAAEEHSAADKLMERSAKTKPDRTQQVARAD
jgi:hypothetical protein